MNWKRLGFLVGIATVALVVYRRWTQIEPVDISIDDTDPAEAENPATNVTDLEAIRGIGPAYADQLRTAGIDDGADLAAADPTELAAATDIGEARIQGWIDRITDRTAA